MISIFLYFNPTQCIQIKTVGSGEMIEGWEYAIKTMKIGERAVVRISDPSLGYGQSGVPPVVPPDAEIEIDLEILDAAARKDINLDIDFDTLAMGDPSTPVSFGHFQKYYLACFDVDPFKCL